MARRRIRDYVKEYLQRQAKARREGYKSYGQKRYAKEKQAAQVRGYRTPGEQHRAQREALERVKPARRAPRAISRSELERQARGNFQRHFGTLARPRTIDEHVGRMTAAQLRVASTASADELRRLARMPPVETDEQGNPYNPYWYH
jgi:hypothetical protein